MIGSKCSKIGAILVFALLLNLQSVYSLGVTRPVPYDIELMRGESADFTFQIQATTSTNRILCSYSIAGLDPLEIEFEEPEALINAGSVKRVYGTVTVPDDASYKDYRGKLSVSCGAVSEGGEGISGSIVMTTIGDSPLNVKVVEIRGEEIREITRPELEAPPYLMIIAIIIVIISVIGVLYYIKFGKKR